MPCHIETRSAIKKTTKKTLSTTTKNAKTKVSQQKLDVLI